MPLIQQPSNLYKSYPNMHNKPPTIHAIAPGSELILVVTFALQCGHVIVIGLGLHRVLVTTTTCCGMTVG